MVHCLLQAVDRVVAWLDALPPASERPASYQRNPQYCGPVPNSLIIESLPAQIVQQREIQRRDRGMPRNATRPRNANDRIILVARRVCAPVSRVGESGVA